MLTDHGNLTHHEQMLDAQSQCVPCKLCGGKAVITDAGTGAGYYIACENSHSFNASHGCLIDQRRLGGWAYNVMEWWNRLHAPTERAAIVAWIKAHPEFGSEDFGPGMELVLTAIEQGLHHRAQALADLAEGDAELIGGNYG